MSCTYLQGGGFYSNNDDRDGKNSHAFLKKAVLVLILVIGAIAGFAQQVASPYCLKVKVKPTIDNKPVTGAGMKLFKGEQEITRIDSTSDESVVFLLEKNADYTIEITCGGRLMRRVAFSTDLPEDVPVWPMFRYEMSVELPAVPNLADDFYLDFPVAMISYNEAKDRFEHSKEYTAHIKKQMQEMGSEAVIVNK